MRHSHLLVLAVMILGSLLAVTGCATTAANTAPPAATASMPARTTACKGITTINQALTSLSNVTPNATVGDVKSAQAKVTNAVNTIQAQHPTDPQGLVSQVSAANENLTEKLSGYPDQTPIGQTGATVPDLKARVATAQSKTQQLAAELNCTL